MEEHSEFRFIVQLLELPLPDGFTWVVKDRFPSQGDIEKAEIVGKFRGSHDASDYAKVLEDNIRIDKILTEFKPL